MPHSLTSLFQRLMKAWAWVLLVISAIAIKWVSLYPDFVESKYTYGLYPLISKLQRLLLGWIPFSVGDLFYAFLVLVILIRTYQLVRTIIHKKLTRLYFQNGLKQLIFFFLLVYVLFYGLWGLNYSRQGISVQLGLKPDIYSVSALDSLTGRLINQLNYYSVRVTEADFDQFRKKRALFRETGKAYKAVDKIYPFLRHEPRSLKPSLYSYLGNYLGFQGYYNPFSGEGQVNTTIPPFLEPFVATHEVAHQLGYAKEHEANFVAFLVCKNYESPVFRYSLYFDLYEYAIEDLYGKDSVRARQYQESLAELPKKHQKQLRDFYRGYRNPVEPVISSLYGQYLKANGQPEGKRSYNRIVAWLIAYQRQFGVEAL